MFLIVDISMLLTCISTS